MAIFFSISLSRHSGNSRHHLTCCLRCLISYSTIFQKQVSNFSSKSSKAIQKALLADYNTLLSIKRLQKLHLALQRHSNDANTVV